MRRADPERLYYALEVLLAMPTWVAMAVYLVQVLHFSPLQLVLMGTAMEARDLPLRDPDRRRRRHVQPPALAVVGWLGMGMRGWRWAPSRRRGS